MRRLGAEGLAFDSIVASGPNGAAPLALRASAVCRRATWWSWISARARWLLFRYDTYRVRRRGHAACSRGVRCRARSERGRGGYDSPRPVRARPCIIWPKTCSPIMASRARWAMVWAMAWALTSTNFLCFRRATKSRSRLAMSSRSEPGVYLPGEIGCRLEDFGVVTEDGFEVFTKSTHELVII